MALRSKPFSLRSCTLFRAILFEMGSKKLDVKVAKRIVTKISTFAHEPDPLRGAKGLAGALSGCYRYRVGDHRAIFEVDDEGNVKFLTVLRIMHRKDVYR